MCLIQSNGHEETCLCDVKGELIIRTGRGMSRVRQSASQPQREGYSEDREERWVVNWGTLIPS